MVRPAAPGRVRHHNARPGHDAGRVRGRTGAGRDETVPEPRDARLWRDLHHLFSRHPGPSGAVHRLFRPADPARQARQGAGVELPSRTQRLRGRRHRTRRHRGRLFERGLGRGPASGAQRPGGGCDLARSRPDPDLRARGSAAIVPRRPAGPRQCLDHPAQGHVADLDARRHGSAARVLGGQPGHAEPDPVLLGRGGRLSCLQHRVGRRAIAARAPIQPGYA